jgi:hypothetical protein
VAEVDLVSYAVRVFVVYSFDDGIDDLVPYGDANFLADVVGFGRHEASLADGGVGVMRPSGLGTIRIR